RSPDNCGPPRWSGDRGDRLGTAPLIQCLNPPKSAPIGAHPPNPYTARSPRINAVFWPLARRRRMCFASRRSPVRSRLAPLAETPDSTRTSHDRRTTRAWCASDPSVEVLLLEQQADNLCGALHLGFDREQCVVVDEPLGNADDGVGERVGVDPGM